SGVAGPLPARPLPEGAPMKRQRWRILGASLLVACGVALGTTFPGLLAQDPAKEKAVEVAAEPQAKTIADISRERHEIVEEDGRFTITAYFPNKTDPKRPRWKITCSADKAGTMGGPRENLCINYAFFQPAPEAPEVQVLGLTSLAESMVCYSDGVR